MATQTELSWSLESRGSRKRIGRGRHLWSRERDQREPQERQERKSGEKGHGVIKEKSLPQVGGPLGWTPSWAEKSGGVERRRGLCAWMWRFPSQTSELSLSQGGSRV